MSQGTMGGLRQIVSKKLELSVSGQQSCEPGRGPSLKSQMRPQPRPVTLTAALGETIIQTIQSSHVYTPEPQNVR